MKLVFELSAEQYDRISSREVPYFDVPIKAIEVRHGLQETEVPVAFIEGVTGSAMFTEGHRPGVPGIRVWLDRRKENENGSGNG